MQFRLVILLLFGFLKVGEIWLCLMSLFHRGISINLSDYLVTGIFLEFELWKLYNYKFCPFFLFVSFRNWIFEELHDFQVMRARELDQIFPIIDPKVKRTAKPKIFVSLLWKQLNHLG